MRFLAAAVLLFVAASPARALWPPHLGTEGAGSSAMNWMKFEVGARQVGMAGAGVATSEDPTALFYNPALLTLIPQHQLSLTHAVLYQTIKYDTLCYGQQAGRSSGFGFALSNLSMTRIPRTLEYDANSGALAGQYAGEQERYPADAILLQVGWGTQLAGMFPSASVGAISDAALGVGVKFASMTLDKTTDQAFAADVGYVYVVPETGWRAGIAVTNLGSDVKTRMLPASIRVGASDYAWQNQINLAYDLSFSSDAIVKTHIGLEVAPVIAGQRIAVRIGYKIEQDLTSTEGQWSQKFGAPQGLVAGVGLHFRVKKLIARLDLGYAPFGELAPAPTKGTMRMGFLIGL